jgi:hypothetical protein
MVTARRKLYATSGYPFQQPDRCRCRWWNEREHVQTARVRNCREGKPFTLADPERAHFIQECVLHRIYPPGDRGMTLRAESGEEVKDHFCFR